MNPGLRATIDFLLYDWLRVQALTERALMQVTTAAKSGRR